MYDQRASKVFALQRVGEVEPSLRPDADAALGLGLGLPATESV
jgi:hypothetical protein